jgi:hypothetical protein
MWHQALSDFFAEINFYPTVSDPCLFLCKDNESTFIFVHVDNLIIGGKSIDWVKDLLSSRFEMSDLGEASFVLGIRIVRNRPNRQIFLVQDQYIKNILTEFGMSDCNGTKTPLIPKINGKPNEIEDVLDNSIDYRCAVGLLNYLVQCTRPDLAFTSSFLSQFLLSPTKKSVAGFHHCLRYLKGTADTEILLGKGESRIMLWADADWGGSIDGRSFSGNLVTFLGPVAWRCSNQPVTGLSTTEVEHRACLESGQDISWLCLLLGEIGPSLKVDMSGEPTLLNDNKGAIALLENPLYHHATRHINIRLHWICYHIGKSFSLSFCRSADNLADLLTKSQPGPVILKNKIDAGVITLENMEGCHDDGSGDRTVVDG